MKQIKFWICCLLMVFAFGFLFSFSVMKLGESVEKSKAYKALNITLDKIIKEGNDEKDSNDINVGD